MHYKNGQEALVGDLIVGQGYNVRNPDGSLATIVGTLVGAIPDSDTCNVRIAHARVVQVEAPDLRFFEPRQGFKYHWQNNDAPKFAIQTDIEAGQIDHFDLVYRPGVGTAGDVAKAALFAAAGHLVDAIGEPIPPPPGELVQGEPLNLTDEQRAAIWPDGVPKLEQAPEGDVAVVGYSEAKGFDLADQGPGAEILHVENPQPSEFISGPEYPENAVLFKCSEPNCELNAGHLSSHKGSFKEEDLALVSSAPESDAAPAAG